MAEEIEETEEEVRARLMDLLEAKRRAMEKRDDDLSSTLTTAIMMLEGYLARKKGAR